MILSATLHICYVIWKAMSLQNKLFVIAIYFFRLILNVINSAVYTNHYASYEGSDNHADFHYHMHTSPNFHSSA